jgi:KaiC/GvpD/RAD55 family RecA-like ATPase
MSQSEREVLLRWIGRWSGEQHLATGWTVTNRAAGPDDLRPKQVTTKAWQHKRPLADGNAGETEFGRGITQNPAVILRPSGLVGLECDSEEDLAAIEALKLPRTITVRSSEPYKRHFWFRPPSTLETVPYVAFRFEYGNVFADDQRYLLMPPAIHPSGAEYAFLPGLGPGEIEIAELPAAAYAECVSRWETTARAQRQRPRVEPGAKVPRHDRIFRYACALRNWMTSEDEILEAALAYNNRHFADHPEGPMSERRVRSHVRGAMKMADRPPDADELELRREADIFLREFLAGDATPTPTPNAKPSKRRRELSRRAIAAVVPRPVHHLVGGVIPDRTITSIAGPGGLGKSALVLAWCAELTRQGMNVLVISYEDAAEEVIRPRFEALAGDQERLFVLSINPTEGSIVFPLDLEELARHATETDARLVVIDPISAGIDVRLDSHKDRDVRVVLGRLAKLAEELRLAFVLVVHLNKSPSNDAYTRISGSVGFYNASRSVIVVTRDPLDPDWRRLVAQVKSNYGRLAPVERWRVEVVDVPSEEGPIPVARLVFHEIADDVNRDDVLAPPPAEKRSEAEALILAELAQGRRLSSEVKTVGAKAGISVATMKRAAAELEVVVEDETTEFGRVTYWALPDALGGRLTSYDTRDEPTPCVPHEQAEKGVGSQWCRKS